MKTLVASLGPSPLMLISGLVGLAFAGDAPGSFPVDTPLGSMPVGDITLPIAMVVFGAYLYKAGAAFSGWKPHIVVEHVHINGRPDAPDGD